MQAADGTSERKVFAGYDPIHVGRCDYCPFRSLPTGWELCIAVI